MRSFATIILATALSGCGMTTVDPGYRGVQVYFGDLQQEVLEPGFHIKPFMTVHHMSVQVQATEAVASATTNDLQNVTTTVTLNWARDAGMVRHQFENYPEIQSRIIAPAIQESVKSVTAQYTATELVTKRQTVKDAIETLITTRLSKVGVTLDTLNITDFTFSREFNDSIEAKVKAEQDSLRAEEELVKAEVVARQTVAEAEGAKRAKILAAEGEAEAIRIQGEALRLNPNVLELRRLEKWSGAYPTTLVMGETDGSFLIGIGN